ncbi:MAG: PorT family protein [Sphingobacteriaceae bacterium]|nr:MAG: PorT family protein [Sphingobacteriaceae bacterium]
MSTVIAYSQSKINYKFGLTSGVNAAQIKASTLSNLFWQYNAGVVLEQRFSPAIAVAYQLSYAKQGSSSLVTGLGGDDKIINELTYINLPVMLRFSRESKNFFLEAGGQVGYLLDGKGYFASSKNQATPFHHTHKIDAGLTGGIGYRLGNHLTIDARYYYGLNPILADYTAPDPATGILTFYRVSKWYNRVYSLNMSYYF